MARPEGKKNEDYDIKRERLLDLLYIHMMKQEFREFPSFRTLSQLLNVTPPTLKHYFGDREGLIKSFMEFIDKRGDPFIQKAAVPSGKADYSIREVLHFIASGFEFGPVAHIHQFGLANGLGDLEIGPAYLNHIFEPLLRALEKRILLHQEAGEIVSVEPRIAALALISPLFMVMMHQKKLGGCDVRPINLNDFIHQHADAFMRAYATKPTL